MQQLSHSCREHLPSLGCSLPSQSTMWVLPANLGWLRLESELWALRCVQDLGVRGSWLNVALRSAIWELGWAGLWVPGLPHTGVALICCPFYL